MPRAPAELLQAAIARRLLIAPVLMIDDVLKEILGYDEDRFVELLVSGVLD